MSSNNFGSRTTAQQVVDHYKSDLTGKVIIVTGPTTGIGVETAKVLALTKAHIILAARSGQKGRELEKQLKEETKNEKIEWLPLDLDDLISVKKFVELFLAKNLPLHVLLLNAATQVYGREKTKQGYEKTFGVNHIAHFYLTNLLVDKLKASGPARVVVVASNLHTQGVIDFNDLMNDQRVFFGLKVYANSKLANVLFANEMSRKLEGTGVTVCSLHPGVIATGLPRDLNVILRYIYFFVSAPFSKSIAQGAATSVYCAVAPELEKINGKYYQDCNALEASETARDTKIASRLWEVTEKLINEALASKKSEN